MNKANLILAVTFVILFNTTCANNPLWRKITGGGSPVETMLDEQQYELSKVAKVTRLSKEEIIVRFREEVLFKVDGYSLRSGAEQNLNQVLDILGQYPEIVIIVEGHTDSRGREGYNQWLSEKRSHTVAAYFVEKGLDPYRIQLIGYGETRPVANNESSEGRRRNRRVELRIIPKRY